MKKLVVLAAFMGSVVSASFAQQASGSDAKTTKSSKQSTQYSCPKCHTRSDKPGNCTKCNEALVKAGDYYCSGCGATSSKPGKCAKCNVDMVKMAANK